MGRMEILTGRERRRIWSDAQKLDILADVASSGQSIVEIARRHDIVPQQIYAWRKQFGMRRQPAEARTDVTFLPVTLLPPDPETAAGRPSDDTVKGPASRRATRVSRIEIGCKGGRVLKMDSDLAPELLKALIRSVEEA